MDIVTKRKKCAKRKKSLDKSANQIVNASIAFALRVKRNQCHKKETTRVSEGLGVFLYSDLKKKYFFLLLNFLNFFFRQRRLPPPRKFCALIGAKHNQPCDPWSYHCSNGYVCQKKPINRPRFSGTGNPSLGGFLK